jgi:hypothetical protein
MDEITPDCMMADEDLETTEVSYSDRGVGDYVISGPLGDTVGRGKRFETALQAHRWAVQKYGNRFKGAIDEAEAFGERYAFLIKAP